jgi:hypothetical protein
MNYQLVLQFRGEALRKFLSLPDFEHPIQGALDSSETFDGLDSGAHGANLFFYTDHPAETLERIRPLLGLDEKLSGFVAAYRTIAAEGSRVLWPEESPPVFNLR